MRYANARDVLPEPLVRELQKVVQGGYLYVPKEERSRKRWGEESGYREELEERNRRIFEEHDSGVPMGVLADRYGRAFMQFGKSFIGSGEAVTRGAGPRSDTNHL